MDPMTIVMLVAVVVAFYFLMYRPQKKRQQQAKEHMEALGVGSRIVTIGGIVGTIVHMGEKQAILELAPGIEMTVIKEAISQRRVEDEFEYDDEPSDAEIAATELSEIEADSDSFEQTPQDVDVIAAADTVVAETPADADTQSAKDE